MPGHRRSGINESHIVLVNDNARACENGPHNQKIRPVETRRKRTTRHMHPATSRSSCASHLEDPEPRLVQSCVNGAQSQDAPERLLTGSTERLVAAQCRLSQGGRNTGICDEVPDGGGDCEGPPNKCSASRGFPVFEGQIIKTRQTAPRNLRRCCR